MIWFLGDTHGQFRQVIAAVEAHAPDAIVFLGDVQAPAPLEQVLAPILDHTTVYFIHGNHDTDSEADYDHLYGSRLAAHQLHGRVVEIAGIKVAGLGGIFRSKIWMPPAAPVFDNAAAYLRQAGKGNWWRGGLPLRHRSSIFYDEYLTLATQKADILITHEAPSCHPHGFAAIDALGRAMGIRAAFHCHHHDSLDYSGMQAQLGFAAYGVGLRGIIDQEGRLIRAGEEDAQRRFRQAMVSGGAGAG